MAGRSASKIDESTLTRGQRRKLDTLRKSVGDEIGERAFAAWLSTQPKQEVVEEDHDAALIVDTLWPSSGKARWRSRGAAICFAAGVTGSFASLQTCRLNSRYVGMVWPLPPRDTLSGMAGRRVR